MMFKNFINIRYTRETVLKILEKATNDHFQKELREIEIDEQIPNEAKLMIAELEKLVWKESFLVSLHYIDQLSESPIEKEVCYALITGFYCISPNACAVPPTIFLDKNEFLNTIPPEFKKDESIFEDLSSLFLNKTFWLLPNFYIKEKIRADFVLLHRDTQQLFIIECDSFQFHHSSEQLVREKQREREIIKLGYPVLRFAGKEILENPTKVAAEIINFVTDFLQKRRQKINNSEN